MSRLRDQKGSALLIALLAAVLLIPLGALAVLQARSSLEIQQRLRADSQAFHVAEAGLACAVAALPPDAETADLLAGPDAVAGTADDGVLEIDMGAAGYVPAPPLRVEVAIEAAAADLLRVTATGFAARGATRVLERLVRRTPAPYAPGAVLAGDGTVPRFGVSRLVVSGFDHGPGDDIGIATGGGTGKPAVVYGSAATADAVRSALAADAASRLVGAGTTPSIAQARDIDVRAFVERALLRPDAQVHAPWDLPADLILGSAAAPAITIVDGDATVLGAWTGGGVLIVRGTLRIGGTLDLDGLVVATDGLVLEPAGSMRIRGGLWLRAPPMDLLGDGGIAACAACMTAIDSTFPSLLPHAFEPLAWLEATAG